MKQTFATARALATGIEYVGWVISGLTAVGTAIAWNNLALPAGNPKLVIAMAAAVGLATGLGLVLAAQLVQAQVATAINTSRILEHVAIRTPQSNLSHTHHDTDTPSHSMMPSRPEPSVTDAQAEGRYLRTFKGFELHKFSDGISVNGEGRYPTILEAEKRAAALAALAET